MAAPSHRFAPRSSACVSVSASTIVRLARRAPIDRTLVVAVVFRRDRAAGQALDLAQLAYFARIAQRDGDASSAGARGAADPMNVAFWHVGEREVHGRWHLLAVYGPGRQFRLDQ